MIALANHNQDKKLAFFEKFLRNSGVFEGGFFLNALRKFFKKF